MASGRRRSAGASSLRWLLGATTNGVGADSFAPRRAECHQNRCATSEDGSSGPRWHARSAPRTAVEGRRASIAPWPGLLLRDWCRWSELSPTGLSALCVDLREQLLARDHRVGEVIVHPGQMLPAVVDDAVQVPVRDVLLLDVLGHQRRIDLVDVLEAADDHIGHAVNLWRLFC